MGLTITKVESLKTLAAGKDVVVLIGSGDTISGRLVDVTQEHIKLESDEETAYLTVDAIKAIRIRK
jgi:hypothetical protein